MPFLKKLEKELKRAGNNTEKFIRKEALPDLTKAVEKAAEQIEAATNKLAVREERHKCIAILETVNKLYVELNPSKLILDINQEIQVIERVQNLSSASIELIRQIKIDLAAMSLNSYMLEFFRQQIEDARGVISSRPDDIALCQLQPYLSEIYLNDFELEKGIFVNHQNDVMEKLAIIKLDLSQQSRLSPRLRPS